MDSSQRIQRHHMHFLFIGVRRFGCGVSGTDVIGMGVTDNDATGGSESAIYRYGAGTGRAVQQPRAAVRGIATLAISGKNMEG